MAIQVHDVECVAAFYRDVIGCPELARHTHPGGALRSIWVSVSGEASATGGFLAIEELRPGVRGTLGPSMVALRIDPAARAGVLVELAARGLAVEKQTRWTVYVRDPEGNLVGLSHHPVEGTGPAVGSTTPR